MANVVERRGDAVAAFFDEGYDVFMVNTNCHSAFYSPLHQRIQKMLPELYEVDQQTRFMKPEKKLGSYTTYSFGDLSDEFPIAVNLYGQLNYGIGKRHINYAALTCSLLNACGFILDGVDRQKVVKVCCPKIGAGLAGGDWEIVKEILEFCPARIEFYVYSLQETLMKDYHQIEDQFIFNLTEDILLTLEDAGVDAEKAAKYLGVGLPTFFDYVNGDSHMSIEEIVCLCHLCGAEIDVVITRNGENVRRKT